MLIYIFIATYLTPNYYLFFINSARLELEFLVEKLESEQMLPIGKRCRDQGLDDIHSVMECRREAQFLGLPWGGSVYLPPNRFPACFYNQDNLYMVTFNTNPRTGSSNLNPNYFAICKTYSRGTILKCI